MSQFLRPNSVCLEELTERFQYLFEAGLIEEMCQFGEIRNFSEDEMIIDIGYPVTHMPVVISGSLKIMTEDSEGNELLLYYLEIGDTCAVTLNCCNKKNSKSNIRAITESQSRLIFIPIGKMEEWMVRYKSWRNFVLESYNSRLNEMLSALDNLAFNNMEERLIKYLKEKVWVNKSPTLNITHYQIANDLHSSRVVISRLMKKLEQNKLLKQHRNKLEILEY